MRPILHSLLWPLLLWPALSGAEVKLRFKLEPDDVLTVDKYQDIVVMEGARRSTREEKNRIVLKVSGQKSNAAVMTGLFARYARSPRQTGQFHHIQDFPSEFAIQPDGTYLVPEKVLMPNLQSLPTFPDHPLKEGDRWQAAATEIIEIGNRRLKVPLTVNYLYHGQESFEDHDGKKRLLDRISYHYTFLLPVGVDGLRHITGFSADRLYFDREAGIPVFDSNRLQYSFVYQDGRLTEYRFLIDSWWQKFKTVAATEKEAMRKSITQELKNLPSVRVRENEQGIVLDLDAILFDHDSAQLSPRALREIEQIARVLERYPSHEIRISGHTDSTGLESYNQTLSEKRALSVLTELVEKHKHDPRRFSYRGFGARTPVAPNTTAEGRARNRRVEILIMTR
ncbi:MAG: OmpA family protein [Spirochaetales bacterium]|nr:OmpA family protein [Spirochaetales bacterium]